MRNRGKIIILSQGKYTRDWVDPSPSVLALWVARQIEFQLRGQFTSTFCLFFPFNFEITFSFLFFLFISSIFFALSQTAVSKNGSLLPWLSWSSKKQYFIIQGGGNNCTLESPHDPFCSTL